MDTPQRTKVLFIASSYPRSRHDTAAIFLRYLAEYLTDHGVDVHVLAPADGAGEAVVEGNVTVHRFQYFPATFQRLAYGSGMLPNLKHSPSLWIQVPFFFLAMTYSMLRLLATHRYHLIHAHWVLPQGLVGLIGSRLFGIPLVVSVHGTDAFALGGTTATGLKTSILKRSAAWTANTAMTAAAIANDPSVPQVRVIPMGVNIEHFSSGNPTKLRGDIPKGNYLVLFVGRLIENKGCRDLIEAISRLSAETRGRTKLWVVGDGDQQNQLERTAKGLGVGEKVRFFGSIDHHHLPEFYAAADLVVVPSKAGTSGEMEGQSVVVLEAFAARVAVVASAIGGIPSMVRDQVTGWLVEPGNPQALSGAIANALTQPELRQRITETAFREVCERYSWQHIAGEFSALYSEIVASRQHS